ncbi:sporulation protein YabP [Evansella vedderi]|uniref:Sporulation protein YabP n=1 Tax=Evansella vedderi TaxID=38282 RepID=A0ABU0A3Q0_9BACI|nr:sporulation protein YabP [Evansella vedderi]MDQ0257870.1 sporulation protein YabP [Evansella vedderi]
MEHSYGYTAGGQGRKTMDHSITMRGRKTLDITGVKQVESFDNEEFLLETVMGFLSIRGQHLQMKNLDVDEGNVSIQGRIDDLVYLDEQHTGKSKGLFGKLFK